MIYKQNLHQHSTYCDGADTPEQVIDAALKRGFDSIGFSGHSYMHYAPDHSMSESGTEQYIAEIKELKCKYRGIIDILCGIEFDMYSVLDLSPYDYVIGSLHYLDINGEKIGFDRSEAEVRRIINTYFDGDGMRFAKQYYKDLAMLPKYADCDILGHADLICKHLENANFFDTDSKEYRFAAIEALEALKGKIPYFEVNTGAIARGYRKTPYPAPFLLREFKRLGFGAIISSDCHDARFIDCGFNEAEKLLKEHGFDEIYVLKNGGFTATPI